MNDEAGSHLSNEENNFMFDNAYGEESLDELTAFVMLMARLQPAAKTTDTMPSYDDKAISQAHNSSKAHEQLAKKAFKERENQYLEDIVDLEEKLSCHDRIVYKMGQSLQMSHMLGKKPNKIYDPFLKARLGYQNHERLKKAIAAQPKMYDGDMLHSEKLIISSIDSEETLEDAEEIRNKMKNKMIQVNYYKIKALYETFVPQQEISAEQTYFSIPSTSNHSSESKDVPSESPVLKMPNEKILLQKEVDRLLEVSWTSEIRDCVLLSAAQQKRDLLKDELDKSSNNFSDYKLRTHAYGDVRAENQDLLMTIFELKSKLCTIERGKNVNTNFDSSKTLGKRVYVTPFNKQIAHKAMNVSNTKVNSDRSKPVTSQSTPKQKQGVESSHSVRRSTSKDIKSNCILKNTKSSSTYVWKTLNSACLDSNKSNTTKTVKACVNVVKDGLNIVCISCGNDVFLNSHEKCVAYHALSRKSSVKSALVTSPLAAKSKNLVATSVGTKYRLSVATTPTSTNKVIQLVLWIIDIECLNHMTGNLQLLRNFIKKFIGTDRFGNDHFIAITGYRDYVQGNLTIYHVYYVEGLGHNLVFVGQLCDGDLESHINKILVRHCRLSHLNFGTINQLTSNDLVDGLPKLKYTKDHLCSACEQGKSKKASLPSKLVPSIESKLELLHKDLCGPMRVASINGKKYILVIVDDYSRYTWAIATACFTQTGSIVHTRHNKTPYELIRGRKPNTQYFHVFRSLCYPTNNRDDLGKMKPKVDIGIFIGYSESSRGFRIYSRRTQKIMETIHVKFDELTAMASECNNLEPEMNCMNFNNSSEGSQSIPLKFDLDNLFGPLYEEYYETSLQEVSNDSVSNTNDNDHTSSSSSIVIDQDDAPPVVSLSDEQVSTAPNFLVMNEVADEFVQEDVADFDGNMFHNAP
ncbi:retrovirus-related pol polyprotein from transposon TNT 1-94 [Tanacetum coccineum]